MEDEAAAVLRSITLRPPLEPANAREPEGAGWRGRFSWGGKPKRLVRPSIWVLLMNHCTIVWLRGVAKKKVDCCVYVCAFWGVNIYPMGGCVVYACCKYVCTV